MANFKLDATNDLDFSEPNLQIITGPQEIAQKIENRFKFFLGEWYLDTRLGANHYGVTFTKGTSDIVRREMFRRIVAETPGVIELLSFTFQRNGRTLNPVFSARVVGADDPVNFSIPFILEDI